MTANASYYSVMAAATASRPEPKEQHQRKGSGERSPTKGKLVAEGFTAKSRMKNALVRNPTLISLIKESQDHQTCSMSPCLSYQVFALV